MISYTPEQLREFAARDATGEWYAEIFRAHAAKIEECERYRKALDAALPYVLHCGGEREPHPQQWLVDQIRAALREGK